VAFDLVVDVHRDLVALPAGAPAGVLVAKIGKTIEETDAPRDTKARLIKDYIKKARGKIQTYEDREARLAFLTEQARILREAKEGKSNDGHNIEYKEAPPAKYLEGRGKPLTIHIKKGEGKMNDSKSTNAQITKSSNH
jgi:hypothetical protein